MMFEFFRKKNKLVEPGEQLIEFGRTADWIPYPQPASKSIPDWYKNTPKYTNGNEPIMGSEHQSSNLSVKYCIPFLDALTVGYTAHLWCDLKVEQRPAGPWFTWRVEPSVLDGRNPEGLETLPIPHGHSDNHFIWHQPFSVRVPKGYSVLYTHPFNRYDLPFTTLTGIHDSDTILPPGNFPFHLKEGFEGIIPSGTPIFQMLPFKREDWVGLGNPELQKEGHDRSMKSVSMVAGYYKKKRWSRKNYRMVEIEDDI
jgi:hypothetical protein